MINTSEELLEKYDNLIKFILKRNKKICKIYEYDDVLQELRMCCLNAFDKYNSDKSMFSTYLCKSLQNKIGGMWTEYYYKKSKITMCSLDVETDVDQDGNSDTVLLDFIESYETKEQPQTLQEIDDELYGYLSYRLSLTKACREPKKFKSNKDIILNLYNDWLNGAKLSDMKSKYNLSRQMISINIIKCNDILKDAPKIFIPPNSQKFFDYLEERYKETFDESLALYYYNNDFIKKGWLMRIKGKSLKGVQKDLGCPSTIEKYISYCEDIYEEFLQKINTDGFYRYH